MNDRVALVELFKNLLDIPEYYIYEIKSTDIPVNLPPYANVGIFTVYIDLNIPSTKISLFEVTNDVIYVISDTISYRLHVPLDNYLLLIIDDIIKSFKGEFL